MTLYEALELVHVVAVIVWIGGSIMISILMARSTSTNDRQTVASLTGHGEFLGRFVFNPAGIVTLGAGIWMVIDGPWEFSDTWISLGFVGIAVGALLGALFYPKQFRAAGDALAAGGDLSDPSVAAPLSRLRTVATAETLLLLVVVWAMMVKPGG